MPPAVALAAIFLAASFTQGVSGFGTALVAMPLLTLMMDVRTATPLCMLNGLIITGYLTVTMRRHIPWHRVRPLTAGTLPGIAAGLYLLKEYNSNLLQILLALFIIAYAGYSLCCRPSPRRLHPAWAYVAGFFTGAIGSAFSAGGPPTIVYLTMTGRDKDEIKATLSAFFFINGIITATGHAASGLTTPAVLHALVLTAPATVVGVVAGARCYGRIPTATYIKTILYLLIAMGLMLLYSALR